MKKLTATNPLANFTMSWSTDAALYGTAFGMGASAAQERAEGAGRPNVRSPVPTMIGAAIRPEQTSGGFISNPPKLAPLRSARGR